jgi:hypothetical protein
LAIPWVPTVMGKLRQTQNSLDAFLPAALCSGAIDIVHLVLLPIGTKTNVVPVCNFKYFNVRPQRAAFGRIDDVADTHSRSYEFRRLCCRHGNPAFSCTMVEYIGDNRARSDP